MGEAKPKLRSDLKITRQKQKDGVYYVIKDPITQEYHRFPANEYRVISLFDGTRTLAGIAEAFNNRYTDLEVDMDVVHEFHSALNSIHLIEKPLAEKNLFLLEKQRELRKSRLLGAKGSPMYFRISLLDPDWLLNRIYPRVKWFFTGKFLIFSFLLFAMAGLIIFQEWERFLDGINSITTFSDKTPAALLSLWATVVVVIFFHELGHAFTCKHFGGEVHEMGLLMLFFTPCFYANVNDAWSFPKRYQKLAVTFAGGYVEFIIGAFATFLWYFLNPGTGLSSISYQVMTICAVSSVMFNFNPLMKLDGYYAFSDFVEIPNLKSESAKYVRYLAQKMIFRLKLPYDMDAYTLREKRILFFYGICSIIYMTGVMLGLFFMARNFLLDNLRGVGVLLSFLVAWKLFKRHFLSFFGFIMDLFHQKFSLVIKKPLLSGLLIFLTIGLAVTALGKRHFTLTKNFTLEPAHLKKIYAPMSGFLQRHKLEPGGKVQAGDTLAVLEDTSDVEALEKLYLEEKREKVEKSIAMLKNKPGDAYRAGLNLNRLAGEIGLKKQELASGRLICSSAGVIYSSQAERGYLPYFSKGSELFEFARLDTFYIQVPLLESELGEIQIGDKAELRLRSALHKKVKARIKDIAPVPVTYFESSNTGAAAEGVENKFNVKVLVCGSENAGLYPGMTGEVRIYSGRTRGFLLLWKSIKRLVRPDLFL